MNAVKSTHRGMPEEKQRIGNWALKRKEENKQEEAFASWRWDA